MINPFKSGERVYVLDTSSTRIFRHALVLESYDDSLKCCVQMLDCSDIVVYSIDKIKKRVK